MGRIPHSKVEDRAFRLGLPPDMIGVFTTVIRDLDRAYLKWVADKQEQQARKKKK